MTTYYAVCNVNGPISHLLAATDLEAALAECEAADMRQWIDDADCDAEDDLDIVRNGEYANGGVGPSSVDGKLYRSRERAESAMREAAGTL